MLLSVEDRIAMLTGEMPHEYVNGRLKTIFYGDGEPDKGYVSEFKEKIDKYFKYNKVFSLNHKYSTEELGILTKLYERSLFDIVLPYSLTYDNLVKIYNILVKEEEEKKMKNSAKSAESVLSPVEKDRFSLDERDVDILTGKIKFDVTEHGDGMARTVPEKIIFGSINEVIVRNKK